MILLRLKKSEELQIKQLFLFDQLSLLFLLRSHKYFSSFGTALFFFFFISISSESEPTRKWNFVYVLLIKFTNKCVFPLFHLTRDRLRSEWWNDLSCRVFDNFQRSISWEIIYFWGVVGGSCEWEFHNVFELLLRRFPLIYGPWPLNRTIKTRYAQYATKLYIERMFPFLSHNIFPSAIVIDFNSCGWILISWKQNKLNFCH